VGFVVVVMVMVGCRMLYDPGRGASSIGRAPHRLARSMGGARSSQCVCLCSWCGAVPGYPLVLAKGVGKLAGSINCSGSVVSACESTGESITRGRGAARV
jgi:hypothetical protein